MATTTNYGWTTPDDTALVKDGASAIRTLGSSVDTTTKNLNPSTTLGDLEFRSSTSNVNTRLGIGSSGQHLTVVAGVPAWATASDQTPLTTKGDLFTFSTLDARLGVGANGTTLVADSSEATGLKWATPADQSPLTTKGDLFTFSTVDARLAVGTNGQVLTADSSEATGLKFATPAASVPANAAATVATSQNTTSTSYVDLTTAGPSVTVTTGTKALVIVTARIATGDSGATSFMSFEVSGATTVNPADTNALTFRQTGTDTDQRLRASAAIIVSLTAGSNTFKAQYKVSAGTGNFIDRDIFVMNLA